MIIKLDIVRALLEFLFSSLGRCDEDQYEADYNEDKNAAEPPIISLVLSFKLFLLVCWRVPCFGCSV
jgi:hypothetical protein